MKKILLQPVLVICFGLLMQGCKESENPQKPQPELLPVEISKTASYTTGITVSKFTYDTNNQLRREDILVNNVPQKYVLYTCNAAGGLLKKEVFGTNNVLIEQDEYILNSENKPLKDSHSYPDGNGTPTLHHYVTFVYSPEGKLSQSSEFTPAGQLTKTVRYEIAADDAGKVHIYDSIGQLQATNLVRYDGKKNPFHATALNNTGFSGNQLQVTTMDPTGQAVSSSSSVFDYSPEGYPTKITQTFSDGVVKTENYFYRPE